MTADATAGKVLEPTPGSGKTASSSFIRQFLALAGPYWRSEERLPVVLLTLALLALTIGQVVIPVLINRWSADFFDALEQKSMERFMLQIGALVLIVAFSMAITGTHMRVKRRLQLGWRRWLTKRLLDDWMDAGRHYQVTHMPGEHDNPDGRIAEDIRITTEVALDLAHSLSYCLMLLGSFTSILWVLSGPLETTLAGLPLTIPGYMVWLAFLYAGAGTVLALLLGRPLVKATNRRQTAEADFRFGLVHARENSEAIALVQGEADERRRLGGLFAGIGSAWDHQTRALTYILLFTSSYAILATAFPILVAAPRYIAGAITLGVLMQIAQAFQQMSAALSWPVDNLARVAEWRASVERVLSLRRALHELSEDVAQIDEPTIALAPAGGAGLNFRALSIANPGGEVVLSGFDAEIAPGERVLISGDSGAAIKLFKVVAGLWPWGRGRVELPDDTPIFFVPQRPFLPIGPLRGGLCYPAPPDGFPDAALRAALERVGLRYLIGRLDETEIWERTLTGGEQQRLGFARLLLHRPNWMFLEEATDALDPQGEVEMMLMLEEEFPDATVLTVGHHPALEAFHQRKLTLVRAPNGQVFIRDVPSETNGHADRPPGWGWRLRSAWSTRMAMFRAIRDRAGGR